MSHHSLSMTDVRYSDSHSSSNPKMHINPRFVQTKTAQPTSHSIPHFNPNFYSKYNQTKCELKVSTTPMVYVNPKFINVNKLQNDLENARQGKTYQTPVLSVSHVSRPDIVNYVLPQKEPISSTISRSSTSRYKLVNVMKSQNMRPLGLSGQQVCPSPRIALQQVNPENHTAKSGVSIIDRQPSESRYKLVRGHNTPKTAAPKTTVKVGRYKTVPLQKMVSTVHANYPTKTVKAIENNISEFDQHKGVLSRKIDRRKCKIISKCVQVPNVTCKFGRFNKSINIRGRMFSITDKSLKLVKSKCDSSNLNISGRLKVRVNGRTYVQKSQNLFVRKPFVVKNRESLRKNNVPCPVYRKFGKCLKKEKGQCSLLHDKRHIIICRQFLQGQCQNKRCLLSHQVTAEKMPTCNFYLQGCCNRENCPYLHVKLSDSAAVCTDFLKGYCEMGDQCAKRHVYLCPEFARSGKCGLSNCSYPHKEGKETIADRICNKYQKKNALANVLSVKENVIGKKDHKNNEVEGRRYYVRGESQEGTADEIHTTRQKLGSLPSFISL